MNYYVVFIIISTILIFGFQFYGYRKRNKLFNVLISYLNHNDYEHFNELINSNKVKLSFPPYNILFLKLNAAIMQSNKNEINNIIESFNNLKMNNTQKKAIYEKAFYYYLGASDKKKTDKYYNLLKELSTDDIYDYFYDTYMSKNADHLGEVINKLENATEYEKTTYYQLIIDMYNNINDKDNASKYEDLLNDLIDNLINNKT